MQRHTPPRLERRFLSLPMLPRLIRVGFSFLVAFALVLARSRARRFRPLDFGPFEEAVTGLSVERDAELTQLLEDAPLARVHELMGSGALSSADVTSHCLVRIRRLDGWLGSLIELNPEALTAASEADERRAGGRSLGPLDGVPVTLKDNVETDGPMHTTAGSMLLANHVAEHDAPVVVALRQAGAIILGKANLSELSGAMTTTQAVSAVGGPTVNPHDPRFTAGGSSSGPAVSVAAGLCLASVGTETTGSLIGPASFNSVVAMMPSRGLVSNEGFVPLVSEQDSAGPVARFVADAAALLAVMATTDLAIDLTPDSLAGVSVGVLRDDILTHRSRVEDTSDNEAVLARIVEGLRSARAVPVDTSLSTATSGSRFSSRSRKVILGGLAHDTMAYLRAVGAPAADIASVHAFNLRRPRSRMPKGQPYVSLAYLSNVDRATYQRAASEHREAAARTLADTFDTSGVRMLVSISSCHSAWYAAAGFPAISVPAGRRANGMPVGATFIGPAGSDAELLGYAYAFETATQLRSVPRALIAAIDGQGR